MSKILRFGTPSLFAQRLRVDFVTHFVIRLIAGIAPTPKSSMDERFDIVPENPEIRVGFEEMAEIFLNLHRRHCIIGRPKRQVVQATLVLPTPEDMVNGLGGQRQSAFESMRKAFDSPEAYFEWAKQQPEYPDFRTTERGVHRSGQETLRSQTAILRTFASIIYVCDHLIVYLRERHQILPSVVDGWRVGVETEKRIMASYLPSDNDWKAGARDFMSKTTLPVYEEEPLSGPQQETRSQLSPRFARDGKTHTQSHDIRRLLFYMALPSYEQIRGLSAGNRHGYIGVQLTDDRLVLDTAKVGNRLFLLQGKLGDCLKLAGSTKSEIRQSGLCIDHTVHDRHGSWKAKVISWLKS